MPKFPNGSRFEIIEKPLPIYASDPAVPFGSAWKEATKRQLDLTIYQPSSINILREDYQDDPPGTDHPVCIYVHLKKTPLDTLHLANAIQTACLDSLPDGPLRS